jgi:hypothetical protein
LWFGNIPGSGPPADEDLSLGTPAFHPSDGDLSLGTPAFHPSDEDLSLGTPAFHPSDEDLSLGTPAPLRAGFRHMALIRFFTSS